MKNQQIKLNISNSLAKLSKLAKLHITRRSPSTDRFCTSAVGAGTSSVLLPLCIILTLCCSLAFANDHASALSIPYSITYNDGVVENMPADTSSATFAPTVDVSSTTPTRKNFYFVNWCSVTPTSNDGTDSCSGNIYTPGSSWTIDQTGANNLQLYAMWTDKLYMWDATSADCGKTMWDNRDGTERSYTTATINGLCWMTTNLALGKNTTTALTNSNTNLNGSLTSYTLPASSTSGFSSVTARNIYNSNSAICGDNSPCYGYYTYAAATAGTNPSNGAATSDICPYGWRLPASSELTSLKNSYATGSALTGSPFLGVYAGRYVNSQFHDGGMHGSYWSSTANNSSLAGYLYFASNGANVSYNNKYVGSSIRCVAKQ